jgi:hypothetical protein
MTSPTDVARFHAEYDAHPDDRVRLFRAIADVVPTTARVLYPGSYVDIAPSVWFDDVTYVDTDKRAARFFGEADAVAGLIASKRRGLGLPERAAEITFRHHDYCDPFPEPGARFDLLISLYAGFISEHCTALLVPGGTLLVNPSHGDAAMASIDSRYALIGVVTSDQGGYRVSTSDLDTYLIPKRAQDITIDSLHASGRGVGYTRSPFAYLFEKQP